MKKILMVDDDKSFLKVYSEILRGKGYDTSVAEGGRQALELLAADYYDIVLSDVAMPEMNGIQLLKKIRTDYPEALVIMFTGEGSISGAVEAMEEGAYTYLVKPLEVDQLLLNLQRASEYLKLNAENRLLKNRLSDFRSDSLFIGECSFAEDLRKKILQAAPTNSSVLITGESGTGKEIIADMLHENSLNREGPFIKVNCAALTESLLESELFGHEKGAFTGAITSKPGRFEMARGGTLFLDEIGDLPSNLQSKLLRVIQQKEFERVGGIRTIKVDFRLICATNKDLKAEVEKGNFREDLYYRINVIPIVSIPLRERAEDIPLLLHYYIQYFCRELSKPPFSVPRETMNILTNYPWKGNVRELRNLAERLAVFSDGRPLTPEMLPEEMKEGSSSCKEFYALSYQEAKRHFEEDYLRFRLNQNNWNISATADAIGLARKNLQIKIKQTGLYRGSSKNDSV